MKFDKSPQWLIQLFDALQPEVGGVRRIMFGYPAGFTGHGQMYAGLFGDGLFVRLGEEGKGALLDQGGTPFDPMGKRPSREYVVLPASMLEDEEAVKSWMRRALAFAESLPPKEKKPAPRARRSRGR